MLWISGGIEWIERIVAETACHTDHEWRLYVLGIGAILFDRPFRFVEFRIRELSQTEYARWFSGHIGSSCFGAIIEPQSILIRRGRRFAAWLGYDPEIAEPMTVLSRVDIKQQIISAIRDSGKPSPQGLPTAGPEIPGITSAAFQFGELAV